jgi:methylmalonyl-CoA mutase N-terminal domain/subunit
VYAIPTEEAATIALAYPANPREETGVANTIDPLGGSYFVEALTRQIEEQAWGYIHKIDELGGMVTAIEKGYPQAEIADAAYHFQRQIDSGEKVIVGVNKHVTDHPPIPWRGPKIEERQLVAQRRKQTSKVRTPP